MIFNKRFGSYRLVKKLATGGMAEVYLALREGPSPFAKLVALKSILPHVNNDEQHIQMFYNEARLGALFRHPNLVHVYDAAKVDGRHTIAMEFIAGNTAQELFDRAAERQERLPLEIAVEIVSAAALGLHSAHVLNGMDGKPLRIVHRDISPHNILVGYDGQVKVFDFGVAVAASVSENANQLAGKAAYMSPEQCRGRRVTARSDVFALGVVLHELVTGQRLFLRDNQISSIRAITEEAIPSPSQLVKGLPSEIDAIVMTALARSPEDRFESALELHRALHAFMFHMKDLVGEESIAGYMAEHFRNERMETETVVQKILMAPPPSQTAVDLSAIDKAGDAAILASESGGFDDFSSPLEAASASGVSAPSADRALQDEASAVLGRELDRARGGRNMLAAVAVVLLLANVATILFLTSRTPAVEEPAAAYIPVEVRVESTPPGAAVRVDGSLQADATPATVRLGAGQAHLVEVALHGYVPVSRTVTVEQGDSAPLAFALEPDPDSPDAPIGIVRFTVSPDDATVTVDQRRYSPEEGQVVIDGLRLNREYVLRLQREGFEPLTLPFSVDSSEPLDMHVEMIEALDLGRLTILSSPSGAAVTVDGEAVGTTPIEDLELPANRLYTIEVSRSGFQRWRRAVRLGQEATVEAELQRVGAASAPRPAPRPTPSAPARPPASDEDRYQLLR